MTARSSFRLKIMALSILLDQLTVRVERLDPKKLVLENMANAVLNESKVPGNFHAVKVPRKVYTACTKTKKLETVVLEHRC